MDNTIDLKRLPEPLSSESFSLLKRGISDDADICVYINQKEDFAFLDPYPKMDYGEYLPRSERLDLKAYKNKSKVIDRRLKKIEKLINNSKSILEIGASDGAFLNKFKYKYPQISCFCVEPDVNTDSQRKKYSWLKSYSNMEEAANDCLKVETIAMFHVFEHIEKPKMFLSNIRKLLINNGTLLIEIPCLYDPLLSLYDSSNYEEFYFQRQHPYIYTAKSIERVLAKEKFKVDELLYYQKYGLENHLQWLSKGRPGGNEKFRKLFENVDANYCKAIENSGKTDTIIITARRA